MTKSSSCNPTKPDCLNPEGISQMGVNPATQPPTASEDAFDNRFSNLGELKTQSNGLSGGGKKKQRRVRIKGGNQNKKGHLVSLKQLVQNCPNNLKNINFYQYGNTFSSHGLKKKNARQVQSLLQKQGFKFVIDNHELGGVSLRGQKQTGGGFLSFLFGKKEEKDEKQVIAENNISKEIATISQQQQQDQQQDQQSDQDQKQQQQDQKQSDQDQQQQGQQQQKQLDQQQQGQSDQQQQDQKQQQENEKQTGGNYQLNVESQRIGGLAEVSGYGCNTKPSYNELNQGSLLEGAEKPHGCPLAKPAAGGARKKNKSSRKKQRSVGGGVRLDLSDRVGGQPLVTGYTPCQPASCNSEAVKTEEYVNAHGGGKRKQRKNNKKSRQNKNSHKNIVIRAKKLSRRKQAKIIVKRN